MEKRVLLEADVHESSFEAVFEIAHSAFEDAPDQAFLGRPLNGEFLEPAFLDHAHASFERLGVDNNFLVELLNGLDQALDLPDQRGCRRPDSFHNSLGRLLDEHRLEGLLFLDLSRGFHVRLTKVSFTAAFGLRPFPG